MTKSVSKVLTTTTVVAVAATVINQAEALNDERPHHRLRTLQKEEDASTSPSLSMPINVDNINNLIEEEEPKFVEKKTPVDLGILMSSVMKNGGDLTETVSQALDAMGDWDKKEILDELAYLAKHLLDSLKDSSTSTTSKSGKSKSGKSEKATTTTAATTTAATTTAATTTAATCYNSDLFEENSASLFGNCCETSDCANSRGVYCFNPFLPGTCLCKFSGDGPDQSSVGQGQIDDCCSEGADCLSEICLQSCSDSNVLTCASEIPRTC